jgi:hypothetical protein
MKKTILFVIAAGILSSASGCAYGGAAMGSADKVVVTRNDGFLFGILRKAFVCKVADSGLSACAEAESP